MPIIQTIEQYYCPACEGCVGLDHIKTEILPTPATAQTRRQVTLWCDHCGEAYRAEFILRDGVWALDGSVMRLSTKRAATFLASLTRKQVA